MPGRVRALLTRPVRFSPWELLALVVVMVFEFAWLVG